jgi:magnesium chelatase family protein
MLAKINSSALFGVDAFRISVEVSVTKGIGSIITGLPDDAIKESLWRIAIAINNNEFQMPRTKLVINLAPANIRKMGTGFDLPITLGILIATNQVTDLDKLKEFVVIGEMGLGGDILPIKGALCMAYQAKRDGFRGIILPKDNSQEASLVEGIEVYGVSHILEVIQFIQSDCQIEPVRTIPFKYKEKKDAPDFKDVKGQKNVKRALEIAAAGGHNTLLIGSPGIGKTMLAERLPSILPPMSAEEALETSRIYSVANHTEFNGLVSERPFRSPHHTTSDVALVGGGSIPAPGEISLAHNGVLFLDELPEFRRSVIEVLRQPLENRKVLISRAKCSLEYPASFMLIAAMNPCLCGYLGHPKIKCACSKRAIYWYRRRISSPILQRIDLHIEAESLPSSEVIEYKESCESSAEIRGRVIRARKVQSDRFRELPGIYCNAQMPDRSIDQFCKLDPITRRFLLRKIDDLQFSVRSYARILKMARTISDLAGDKNINLNHVAEAISLRGLDKPVQFGNKETGKTSIKSIHSFANDKHIVHL